MKTKPSAPSVKNTAKKTAAAPAVSAQPAMDFTSPPLAAVSEPRSVAGKLWKMSGRNGVAYVRDAALAGEILKTDPKNLPRAAMAVYYDKKGRAFAWQVRFDTERWAELEQRLG